MSETENIGPFLGPSFTLNTLGKHAYLYSGSLSIGTSSTSFGETATGKYYLVGSWQPVLFSNTTDDIQFDCYLNGQVVSSTIVTSTKDYAPYEEINIIIPPHTTFEIKGKNLGSGSKSMGVIVTGEIFDG